MIDRNDKQGLGIIRVLLSKGSHLLIRCRFLFFVSVLVFGSLTTAEEAKSLWRVKARSKIETRANVSENGFQKVAAISERGQGYVPTSIKRIYEDFVLETWSMIYHQQDLIPEHLDKKMKPALKLILAAAHSLEGHYVGPYQDFVDRIMLDLSQFALDKDMRSCYRAWVIDVNEVNAFNTGCNVFISKLMIDKLDIDEVEAIIAHEMSHGDWGDGVRTIGSFFASAGHHFADYTHDYIRKWITGEVSGRIQGTRDMGHMFKILEEFATRAPAVELRADTTAVRLLHRMGRSRSALPMALVKLHGFEDLVDYLRRSTDGNGEVVPGVRNYPNLDERLERIGETYGDIDKKESGM
ncbi:MAG: M48 family metalloprotease [Pseudobdellovibrionaceae bacterium]|nr:M48 family metalloprotease [Bdellovibrionales bacterium]USN47893.1 MAG: M48 family metalloprotease [Pseudobdellovibrionaceae bacterium]